MILKLKLDKQVPVSESVDVSQPAGPPQLRCHSLFVSCDLTDLRVSVLTSRPDPGAAGLPGLSVSSEQSTAVLSLVLIVIVQSSLQCLYFYDKSSVRDSEGPSKLQPARQNNILTHVIFP